MTKAINDALNSPLLKNRDVLTSKHLLFNIYFDPQAENPLKMDETGELTKFIAGIDPDVDIIWGMAFDRTLGEKVKITILASGFNVTISRLSALNGGADEQVISFGPEGPTDTRTPEQEQRDRERLAEVYGTGAIEQMSKDKAKARYIVLQPYQFDDDTFLDAFEKSPAFNRDRNSAESIRAIGSRTDTSHKSADTMPHVAETPTNHKDSSENTGFKISFG
jgi:cell division protein FtsZ